MRANKEDKLFAGGEVAWHVHVKSLRVEEKGSKYDPASKGSLGVDKVWMTGTSYASDTQSRWCAFMERELEVQLVRNNGL